MAATMNFFRNEKILFLAKGIEFSNRENTYNFDLGLRSENIEFLKLPVAQNPKTPKPQNPVKRL